MKQDNCNQNPWAGLSSYEDPAKSEQKLKFCGRENETKEVARLIDDNFFVTLYGKSGIGKTSLLNAGVFPVLRREQYTPLSLRLGMTEETFSFQDIITQAIEHAIVEIGGSVHVINVIDEQREHDATDYLWRWFARRRFLTSNGQITFPVLVFDQFEEVFRHKESRRKTNVLLEQLNYLIDESHAIGDCVVNGEEYNYDFNFRFVLSIREDDLYRLEDTLDNCSLPALKHCRYRLRSLSEQGARDAILIPGEGLFKEDEKDQIAQTIIGIARNKEDNSISTNLLSLVCNRLYVESQNAGSPTISLSLVDSFVRSNPFERFYNEATHGFSNKEKSYIEEHLVDSTGRRNSIPESDFLVHVKNGLKLIEGKNRILQRVSTSSDSGNTRIELIHDSFCEPLSTQKEKRKQRRKLLYTVFSSFISLIFFSTMIWVANLYIQSKHQYVDLLIQQERLYASKADQIIRNEGDPFSALLLLNELTDENGKFAKIPLQPEAEFQMRKAINNYNNFYWKEIDILRDDANYEFSPKGKYLITDIYNDKFDRYVKLLKADTHEEYRRFPSKGIIRYCISSDDYLLAVSSNMTISLYRIETGDAIQEFEDSVSDSFICDMKFTSDNKYIIYTTRNRNSPSPQNTCTMNVLDIKSNKKIFYKRYDEEDAVCNVLEDIQISDDGSKCLMKADVRKVIAGTTYEYKSIIRVWATNSWKQICEIPYKDEIIARFFDNDNIIVGTSQGLFKQNIITKRKSYFSNWKIGNYAGREIYVLPNKKSIIACSGPELVHINSKSGVIYGRYTKKTGVFEGISIRDSILVTRTQSHCRFYKIPISHSLADTLIKGNRTYMYITHDYLPFFALVNGFYSFINIGEKGEYNNNGAFRVADKNNKTCYYDDSFSYSNMILQRKTNTLYAIARKENATSIVCIKVDNDGRVKRSFLEHDIDVIYSISENPTSTKILCGRKGELCEWNVASNELTHLNVKNMLKASASPQNDKYLIIDDMGELWQYVSKSHSESQVFIHSGRIRDAKYTQDGKHILAISEKNLLLINPKTMEIEKTMPFGGEGIEVNKNWDFVVIDQIGGFYMLDTNCYKVRGIVDELLGTWHITDDGKSYITYPLVVDTIGDIKPRIITLYTQEEIINNARQIVGRKAREGEVEDLLK